MNWLEWGINILICEFIILLDVPKGLFIEGIYWVEELNGFNWLGTEGIKLLLIWLFNWLGKKGSIGGLNRLGYGGPIWFIGGLNWLGYGGPNWFIGGLIWLEGEPKGLEGKLNWLNENPE